LIRGVVRSDVAALLTLQAAKGVAKGLPVSGG